MIENSDDDFQIVIHETTPLPSEEIANDPNSVAERLLQKPTVIHMFTDGVSPSFDSTAMKEYLSQTFGPNFSVEFEGDIIDKALKDDPAKEDEIVDRLVSAKPWAKVSSFWQFGGSLDNNQKKELERQALKRDKNSPLQSFLIGQTIGEGPRGKLRLSNNEYYDIGALGSLYTDLTHTMFEPKEATKELYLIYTGRGIGGSSEDPSIPHARAGFAYGNVAVISTTGLVDAPAKPLEVLEAYQAREALGHLMPRGVERVKRFSQTMQEEKVPPHDAFYKVYEDKMLRDEDPRITEASKGITLQMILNSAGEQTRPVYQCTTSGYEVNPDVSCRMHDAHHQEEVITTQINRGEKPEFCDFHTKLFEKLQSYSPENSQKVKPH
ncbi:hypothetical protein A2962_02735 [Candidatus Woesebacteria bacterium RIFCSPLOWO2_01_FULL_39_61]|uniref:Uncharacterized protein n=1 Tax=Candidatus Woesebacteria bacterium RIFCSPHIGHO2_02_FULL_39_13 TaxID=1802505 RepID=A0A1F7Z208_9BACT|nr:MAG: hypothetical protein A2692_04995 [Candidatus Woesebacteria bacterium RIFCSPHIGHO2_01_FULL_39_95]OGM33541.1 MAG: hypothetical protein A3D01_01135 [Candidatus Woesebacteria bacterium RIFCSPHIGHO2_02_FULL_39_13]OGM38619.1 MAG: hypothetical protein A3E13_04555 [Candidatus Woesebacteria bacterium RIFCSPHIGHO2_12_FULL_40_20]OGM67310.1 MAG: hypothetical protein A2962_02735 [Candidatus Woesebacteria bacterium RIFCSPLOWO2_01_FULL_39_61]OGM74200.1 MAG: hypothetical protein A3H19_05985 [Candidatus